VRYGLPAFRERPGRLGGVVPALPTVEAVFQSGTSERIQQLARLLRTAGRLWTPRNASGRRSVSRRDAELEELRGRLSELERTRDALAFELQAIRSSTSWKITNPLRQWRSVSD
jgi:hypothetical protein